MTVWEDAPWSLRAYVVITLANAVIAAILVTSTPFHLRFFLVAFAAVVCFFLLRRVRWLWIFQIAFIPIGIALSVVEGSTRWYGLLLAVVGLVLLLHPDTRRFFRRQEVPAEP